MTKQAIIVVDIQNDYFPGGKWELAGADAAADNAASVIENARKNGDAVIHIRHDLVAIGQHAKCRAVGRRAVVARGQHIGHEPRHAVGAGRLRS